MTKLSLFHDFTTIDRCRQRYSRMQGCKSLRSIEGCKSLCSIEGSLFEV